MRGPSIVCIVALVLALASDTRANLPQPISCCLFTSSQSALAFQARIDAAVGWPKTDPITGAVTLHEVALVPDGPDGPTGADTAAILTPLATSLLLGGDPTPETLPANWGADAAEDLP